MLTKKKILELAKINNLKPIQQERHYLQNLVLLILRNYKVVFKGGTYLWFCHNLPRFSEDLDFTAQGDISPLIDGLSLALKSRGIDFRINDVTHTKITLSFKLGIAGPLFNGNDRSRCFLWVEISKRENLVLKPIAQEIYFPYYDLESKIIKGMDLNEVFAEKVRAIMSRKKGRDIFDLFFLIKYKNILPNYDLINKKLKFYNEIFDKEQFFKELKLGEGPYNLDLKNLVFITLPKFKEVSETIKKAFE